MAITTTAPKLTKRVLNIDDDDDNNNNDDTDKDVASQASFTAVTPPLKKREIRINNINDVVMVTTMTRPGR